MLPPQCDMEIFKDGNIAKVTLVGEASSLCPFRRYGVPAVPIRKKYFFLERLTRGRVNYYNYRFLLEGQSEDASPTIDSIS